MKILLKLFAVAFLMITLANCNTNAGKYILNLSLSATDTSVDPNFENTTKVIIDRLVSHGIDKEDVTVEKHNGALKLSINGVNDIERVKRLVTIPGRLSIWETHESTEVYSVLVAINDMLAAKTDTTSKTEVKTAEANEELSLDDILQGKNSEGNNSAIEESRKANPLFAFLYPAIIQENNSSYLAPGPAVGYALITDTTRINQLLNIDEVKRIIPSDLKLCWTSTTYDDEGKVLQLVALKKTKKMAGAAMSNIKLVKATQEFNQYNNLPEIQLQMNEEDAVTWAELTERNIARSLAMVIDGHVYSFPTVNGMIIEGRSSITGNFTLEEAKDFANVIGLDPLPINLEIASEEVIEIAKN